jgi:hypothetical protein
MVTLYVSLHFLTCLMILGPVTVNSIVFWDVTACILIDFTEFSE